MKINLPIVIGFDNYHEIDEFVDDVKKILPDIRGKEILDDLEKMFIEEELATIKAPDGYYLALLWEKGKMPKGKEEIRKVLEESCKKR